MTSCRDFEMSRYRDIDISRRGCASFLDLEGEGADEVAVAEEIDVIEAFLHFLSFVKGAVTNAFVRFAAILNLLRHRIRNLAALERKEFRFTLTDEVSFRSDDTGIEVLQARRTGDVFGYHIIELQLANMARHLRLSVVLTEGRKGT